MKQTITPSALAQMLMARVYVPFSAVAALSEADQDFIVSVYGLGITGIFLRWIGANMIAPPEPMIRQLYRLMGGSLEGIVQRFLMTADEK